MVVLKRCFFLYPTSAVLFVYAIPSILSSLFAALIFASEVNPDIRKECEWQPMHLLIARSRGSPDSLAARELFIGSLKEPRLMVFHRCLLAPGLVRGGDHGMEGRGGYYEAVPRLFYVQSHQQSSEMWTSIASCQRLPTGGCVTGSL